MTSDIVALAREVLGYAYEHPETGHIVFDIYDPEALIERLADEIERLRAERGDTIGPTIRADQMRRDAELIDDTALEWAGTPLGSPAEQLVPASLARESALAGMARAADYLRALASDVSELPAVQP